MLFALLVMDMEDDKAQGENVPIVEEREHFQPQVASESQSVRHVTGLD
jgi:hypothetical protein